MKQKASRLQSKAHGLGMAIGFMSLFIFASFSYWIIFAHFLDANTNILGTSIAQLPIQGRTGEGGGGEPTPPKQSPPKLSQPVPTSTPIPKLQQSFPTSTPTPRQQQQEPTSTPPPNQPPPLDEPPIVIIYPSPPIIPIDIPPPFLPPPQSPPAQEVPPGSPPSQSVPPGSPPSQGLPPQVPELPTSTPAPLIPFIPESIQRTILPLLPWISTSQPTQTGSVGSLAGTIPIINASGSGFRFDTTQPLIAQDAKTGELINILENQSITIAIDEETGKFVLKTVDKSGVERIIKTNVYPKIANILAQEGLFIYRGSDNTFIIQHGAVGAQTSFELSLDLIRRKVVVQTPTGPQNLGILPSRALEFSKDINRVTDAAGNNTSISSLTHLIQLVNFDGSLAYEISGCAKQHLGAFWPVCPPLTVITSASQNEFMGVIQSRPSQLLDILSL